MKRGLPEFQWLALYLFSWACYLGYVLVSVGAIVAISGTIVILLGNTWAGGLVFAWMMVPTLVGLEWIRFRWNRALNEDMPSNE